MLLWCRPCWSVVEIQRAGQSPRNTGLRENSASKEKKDLIMSSYYPKYLSNFNRARLCFIIPLRGLSSNARVWNLLFSCRRSCPARTGEWVAEIFVKGSGLEASGHEEGPVLGLQGLPGRFGSTVWVWTSVLLQHQLLEPPSYGGQPPWALVPTTSCSSAFYLCVCFKLNSKVEPSYSIQVGDQKSWSGMHAPHVLWPSQNPVAIT